MIGQVTWVGHITCNECPAQVKEIHWGEAKKTLKRLGWKSHSNAAGIFWVCPLCAKRNKGNK